MDPNYGFDPLPYNYQVSPLPTGGGGSQVQVSQRPPSIVDKAISWVKQNVSPRMAATLLMNPQSAVMYAAAKLGWAGLQKLGEYAVPTNPQGTINNMDWMGGDPSDPFGYVGTSYGPEGAMANSIEERIFGQIEANHPDANIPRSWSQPGSAPGGGGFGGMMFGPGGMSSYMMPVAGGGPGIPVIEGPKYTGAPYNPQAFSDYAETGDTSWWDLWQKEPWQMGNGGVPMPGMPGGAPVQPRSPADFANRIPGQRSGDFLYGPRNDATDPIYGGGYGDPGMIGGGVGVTVWDPVQGSVTTSNPFY